MNNTFSLELDTNSIKNIGVLRDNEFVSKIIWFRLITPKRHIIYSINI